MAQETVTLNKPLFKDSAPPPGGGHLGAAAPREVPTFAGFWLRFLALTIDLLIVVVLHNLLANAGFVETFYSLGAAAPLVGIGALLVIFVALPLTALNGQTPGQKLLRLRVVNANFETPSLGAMLLRTLLIFFLFVPQWLLAGPVGLRDWFQDHPLILSLIQGVVFSLYLTQGTLFALNPIKRGIHDIWADTYVVRLDSPEPVPRDALQKLDAANLSRALRMQRMGVLMVPALALLFVGQLIFSRNPEREAHQRQTIAELREITGPGVHFMAVPVPPISASPESHILQVIARPSLSMAWSEVASSEEYRSMADRALDLVERNFDYELDGERLRAGLPHSGSVFAIIDDYVLVPGLPVPIGGPLAAGQRAEIWNRQYLRVPTHFEESPERDGYMFGTALNTFTLPPSPEVSASPEAIASAEITVSPEFSASPEVVATPASL